MPGPSRASVHVPLLSSPPQPCSLHDVLLLRLPSKAAASFWTLLWWPLSTLHEVLHRPSVCLLLVSMTFHPARAEVHETGEPHLLLVLCPRNPA